MAKFGQGWANLFRAARDAVASKFNELLGDSEKAYRQRELHGSEETVRHFHPAPPPLPKEPIYSGPPPVQAPPVWNSAQFQKVAESLYNDQTTNSIDNAIDVARRAATDPNVTPDIQDILNRAIPALEEWKRLESERGPSQQGPPKPPESPPPKGPSDYQWPEQPEQKGQDEYDWPVESYIDIEEDESVRRTSGSSNVYSYVWFSNDYTVMDEGYVARRPRVASKKAEKNGTLIVTFKAWEPGMKQSERPDTPGATYAYSNVSEMKYNLFNSMAESSAGEAVWDYLRLRGTLTGHQHSYRLISVSGEYVPRKATARGFRAREMIMPPKFSSPITATKPSTLPPGPLTRFGRPISPEEALSPRQARAYARRGGYPNRGEPNRGQP